MPTTQQLALGLGAAAAATVAVQTYKPPARTHDIMICLEYADSTHARHFRTHIHSVYCQWQCQWQWAARDARQHALTKAGRTHTTARWEYVSVHFDPPTSPLPVTKTFAL